MRWYRAFRPPSASHRRVVCLVLACLLGSTFLGQHWRPPNGHPLGRVDKVVVVGIPHLGLSDLAAGRTPALRILAGRGGLAALNVRTLGPHPTDAEAYATLGAGERVAVPVDAATADVQAAAESAVSSPGTPAAIVVPAARRLGLGAKARHLSSFPGALGQALDGAHLRTGVVGTPEVIPGVVSLALPGALAVMNARGEVGFGTVGAQSPMGATSVQAGGPEGDALIAATHQMLDHAEVVMVAAGGPDRATAVGSPGSEAWESARRASLVTADNLVGGLVAHVSAHVLVIVVGVDPPAQQWELTPVVAIGPGVERGTLVSPTTKRAGLVTLEDIAPTILSALGVSVPAGMSGQPITVAARTHELAQLVQTNRDAVYRETLYVPAALIYIALQAVLYVLAAITLRRGGRRRSATPLVRGVLRFGALAVATVPLATYVWRAIPGMARLGGAGVGVLGAVAVAIAGAAAIDTRHPLNPLRRILAATIGLLLVDLATGAHLQPGSLLGYSLHTASRFYGLGNTALAVLMTASVLAAGLYLDGAADRDAALGRVVGLFVVVVFVAAMPFLGAKVGAVTTLIPVFVAMVWRASGRRLSWAAVARLAVAVAAGVGALGAVDALRPASQRTHLGRLTAAVAQGRLSALPLVIGRRLQTTARLITAHPWSELVPVLAVVALFMLVRDKRVADLLPLESPLRIAVLAAIAGGLLGVIVNDSGSIMVGMVLVYLGPLVVMLACDRLATLEDPAAEVETVT